jgi:hypothetical protein
MFAFDELVDFVGRHMPMSLAWASCTAATGMGHNGPIVPFGRGTSFTHRTDVSREK